MLPLEFAGYIGFLVYIRVSLILLFILSEVSEIRNNPALFAAACSFKAFEDGINTGEKIILLLSENEEQVTWLTVYPE